MVVDTAGCRHLNARAAARDGLTLDTMEWLKIAARAAIDRAAAAASCGSAGMTAAHAVCLIETHEALAALEENKEAVRQACAQGWMWAHENGVLVLPGPAAFALLALPATAAAADGASACAECMDSFEADTYSEHGSWIHLDTDDEWSDNLSDAGEPSRL